MEVKERTKILDPIVLFILTVITLMEFLIYGASVINGAYVSGLVAMINLLIFGSLLVLVNILLRVNDGIENIYLFLISQNTNNKTSKQKNKKSKK